MRLQTLLQSAIFAKQSKQPNKIPKPTTMKGKHFNTTAVLTVLFGNRKEKTRLQETTRHLPLLHTRLYATRKEIVVDEQPLYRSVTALIH